VAENRVALEIPNFFAFTVRFWRTAYRFNALMEETDIEIMVDGEMVFFSWNNESIQSLAEELGETDFPEPRPCG